MYFIDKYFLLQARNEQNYFFFQTTQFKLVHGHKEYNTKIVHVYIFYINM